MTTTDHKNCQVKIIPCLADNYIYLLTDKVSKKTAIIDPGEALPVLDNLNQRAVHVDKVLLTHKHPDHTGGVETLKKKFPSIPSNFLLESFSR